MYHTVTRQQRPGSRLINFIRLGEDFFLQSQVEQRTRNGKEFVFMRAKKRVV